MFRIIPIVVAISTISCSPTNDGSYVDLGEGFKYIDEYPNAIIFSKSKESPGSGENVVDPIVMAYCVNEKFIYAISKDEPPIATNNAKFYGNIHYWIIDKKTHRKSNEVDSTFFYLSIKEAKLELIPTQK